MATTIWPPPGSALLLLAQAQSCSEPRLPITSQGSWTCGVSGSVQKLHPELQCTPTLAPGRRHLASRCMCLGSPACFPTPTPGVVPRVSSRGPLRSFSQMVQGLNCHPVGPIPRWHHLSDSGRLSNTRAWQANRSQSVPNAHLRLQNFILDSHHAWELLLHS